MPSPIVPKALQPGATIAYISPSARLNDELPDVMTRATAVLSERGYNVRTFFNKDTGIQSSISNRLSEIRAAFSDPDISAIICTIGGPSFTELLPALIADTELHDIIRANPKIFVGFSDITGFHWFLHALTGLRTFYGPCAIPELGEANSANDEHSPLAFCVKHLFRAIASREPLGEIPRSLTYAPKLASCFKHPASLLSPELAKTHPWTWLRPGKAEGRLFGGCLTVVARLNGIRAIVPQWRGRIVFLETAMGDDGDSGNPLSRVRAGFADLIAQGVFEEAAGLIVGRPFGYDSEEARQTYAGVITGLLCEGRLAEKKFPILFNVDIGHTTPIVTLPYDALAVLDSEKDVFAVLESGVVLLNARESGLEQRKSRLDRQALYRPNPATPSGTCPLRCQFYVILGRIILLTDGEQHLIVKRKWFTKLFVCGDVVSFFMQGAGGGIMASGTVEALETGEHIIIGGLVVQIVVFSLFAAVAGIFHRRMWLAPTTKVLTGIIPWQSYLHTLYGVSLLIMIRSLFRLIEYAQGNAGYLISHEVFLYSFDSVLMFGTMVLFAWYHPSDINAMLKRSRGKAIRRAISLYTLV